MRVPGELTQYKQWVLWRRAEVNGRKLKMPTSPWSGKAASCDKPETRASFRHACFAPRKYKADGIGFVFTAADPFCGIDLDKCRSRRESMIHLPGIGAKAEQLHRTIVIRRGFAHQVRASMLRIARRTEGIEIYAAWVLQDPRDKVTMRVIAEKSGPTLIFTAVTVHTGGLPTGVDFQRFAGSAADNQRRSGYADQYRRS
jgi:hypothetical protein